ncbi:hypothetical protein [Roseimaritima multifibrata]|uniref:hypothetical protein n=1 Tax=Roseimaritima multifibrata TaxID=1930274 RepID=UPI0011A02EE5|nr:hypothetical protein [Roseimaritima multifibrata]
MNDPHTDPESDPIIDAEAVSDDELVVEAEAVADDGIEELAVAEVVPQVVSPKAIKPLKPTEGPNLKTSRFDSVSSWLMALALFVGIFVTLLFVIWLTRNMKFASKPFPPIIEEAAGRGDNAEGFERDFEPPGAEEVEELTEPTLADTLEAVTDAVSSVAASLDTMNTNAPASTAGTGSGDSRPPGPEGEGEDIVPRFERWRLNFKAKDVSSYAKQLDFYKIELAAVGGGVQGVDIASNLSGGGKKRKVDTEDPAAKRLYFSWTDPSVNFAAWDEQLLKKAGVPLGGKRIRIQLIPENLENELAHIELAYATEKGHPSVTEIAQTVFESTGSGNSFKFEVIEQRYRKTK